MGLSLLGAVLFGAALAGFSWAITRRTVPSGSGVAVSWAA